MFNGTSGDQTIKRLVVPIAEVLFIAKIQFKKLIKNLLYKVRVKVVRS